jgi:hypothetical protein
MHCSNLPHNFYNLSVLGCLGMYQQNTCYNFLKKYYSNLISLGDGSGGCVGCQDAIECPCMGNETCFNAGEYWTTCVNTGSGSYKCLECPPGFIGDGQSCVDIDEVVCNRELYRGWAHRDRDRMVVGYTTTCAINAYHHQCCEVESISAC